MSLLQNLLNKAAADRKKLGIKTEMERILELPREELEEHAQHFAELWSGNLRKHPNAPMLRPEQGLILETCHRSAQLEEPVGLLANVGVGKGKSLAFALMPSVFGSTRPILLIPPQMRQPTKEQHWEWSQHYWFEPPEVIAYSTLSRPESTALLTDIGPDLIMADECQALKDSATARTKRFIRYMQNNPETRFAAMSGTLTTSSLKDFAHLSELALRNRSPLPLDEGILNIWCSVLDADGKPDAHAWNMVRGLYNWAEPAADYNVRGARQAFNARFKSSPGVVCTTNPSCDAEILIKAEVPEHGLDIKSALYTLKEEYTLPNGIEIVDALHYHRVQNQIAMGFYYVWDWPNGVEDEEWVDARREWWKGCREYLKGYSREGCDSPFLVEEYVRANQKPASLVGALARWDDQRGKPPPPTKAVWIDYGPLVSAIKWASARESSIIWFTSRAVGEMLEAFGVPTFWDGVPNIESTPTVALSLRVYHEGKNFLTPWHDQLILQPPSSGAVWEQLLGRTFRPGQESPVIKASVYHHADPCREAFRKALQRARYIQGNTLQPQILLMAEREEFIE
tara:strand:- start:7184 stop:8890 length:1707 start_codon:yes stop_codon:yes gene_type:complete